MDAEAVTMASQPLLDNLLILPISGIQGASSRYRVFQFLPALSLAGLTYTLHLPIQTPKNHLIRLITAFQERQAILRQAKLSQAIFLQKRLLSESVIENIAKYRPLAFDFDDSIFTTPNGQRSRITQQRVESRLKTAISVASIVITGNFYLSEYARQFSDRVVYIPTVVDTSRYPVKMHTEASEIVIGWIGHSVNHPYLRAMEVILQRLATRFKIRLLVISDRDLEIPGICVENVRWSEATEVADILRMDIGIMPMPDDPWTRGKCGLKAIQYMAAGLPIVCAAVGANVDIVRNGVDGFCVATENDWFDIISELSESPTLRATIGSAARVRVAESFSLESTTPKIIDALSNLGLSFTNPDRTSSHQ